MEHNIWETTPAQYDRDMKELKRVKADLRKLVDEIDSRGFAAVHNNEAQNAWGWCSLAIKKLLDGK